MKHYVIIFSAVIVLSACSTTKKTVTTVPNKPASVTASTNEPDGSSIEKAIVVTATNEREGIRAEYAWLDKKYPGNKRGGQSLSYHDKKPYDIIKVITADGKPVETYFDISNFFGKY
jgi:hypothetical protein